MTIREFGPTFQFSVQRVSSPAMEYETGTYSPYRCPDICIFGGKVFWYPLAYCQPARGLGKLAPQDAWEDPLEPLLGRDVNDRSPHRIR